MYCIIKIICVLIFLKMYSAISLQTQELHQYFFCIFILFYLIHKKMSTIYFLIYRSVLFACFCVRTPTVIKEFLPKIQCLQQRTSLCSSAGGHLMMFLIELCSVDDVSFVVYQPESIMHYRFLYMLCSGGLKLCFIVFSLCFLFALQTNVWHVNQCPHPVWVWCIYSSQKTKKKTHKKIWNSYNAEINNKHLI